MLRLSRALVRHPSLSERTFGKQYEQFVKRFATNEAVRRYVRGFVGLSATITMLPGQPPRNYDGLMDMWFDGDASLAAFLHDAGYAATIGSEALELFDISACNHVCTADYPPTIGDPAHPPGLYSAEKIRFSTLLVRNPALSFDAFVAHHRTKHAPLFASVPAIKKNIGRYVVAHRIDAAGIAPSAKRYDGIVDFFFDTTSAITEVFVDRAYLTSVHPDEPRFLNIPACDMIFGREIAVD